jgi:NAD(P)-dependent dehydrogenase (short-subunit alcohol dehydrogenase family)
VSLRPGLLDDHRVVIAGDGKAARAAGDRLEALGARVEVLGDDVLADEDGAAGWARERAPVQAVLIDAAYTFAAGGPEALRAAMEHAWRAARAVATGAMLKSETPGRLLFVAPAPDAGPHAPAARAALENLARTLSVEWARFGITAVALTPGTTTTAAELAELVCFLVSPAGGYLSGCRFDLGAGQGVAETAPSS